jgi:GNAT superfamily N-acetyltransferase
MASRPSIQPGVAAGVLRSALTGLATVGRADNSFAGYGERVSRLRERRRDPQVAVVLDRLRRQGPTADLGRDYLARIDQLGDLQLDSRARRAAFPEFVGAFTLAPLRLVMAPERCSCTPDNHAVQMAGRLHWWDRLVATWHRELVLDRGLVVHHLLAVERPYRAAGVGPALLTQGLELYDRLGMQMIVLRAGLESGKWHWARCGFDFVPGGGGEDMVDFYETAVSLLGLPIDTSGFRTASEYALASPEVTITMSRMASLLGSRATPLVREIAHNNDIDYRAPVAAAKALMLCGPPWDGFLRLRGPQRAAFDAYLQSRLKAVRRRLDEQAR